MSAGELTPPVAQDDALDALSLVNAKSDKASVGSQAAKIETHPERRFKAAVRVLFPVSRRTSAD